jgi:Zn-dependent M28 family amino/carboxypeptidase
VRNIYILIFCLILILFVLKLSSFGWRFKRSRTVQYLPDTRVVLTENLKRHVYKLSAEIGNRSFSEYENLQAAADYITAQFATYGYAVQFHDYTILSKTARNIIAVKKGSSDRGDEIIVAAHYDSCLNPGADDNASGIAVLLELARIIVDSYTDCSIRFIAFTNEEPPFFHTETMGSRVYVKEAVKRRDDIKAVIVLEMVGYYSDQPDSQSYPPLLGPFYPNKGNFIAVVGNFGSHWLVNSIVSSFKEQSSLPIEALVAPSFIPGVDFSDHWSFWQEGYAAVMITDTAFYRNPFYHTFLDTYEKLNYQAMSEVVTGLTAVLVQLAQ